ncbi:uncharacterized protein V1518DRAFT_414231 [Limtongia smithiae]|uniref:uncharacterized protein n=1 Tax=Limtongia smithiae TaxID=1125753 RepID=UPI0034CFE656
MTMLEPKLSRGVLHKLLTAPNSGDGQPIIVQMLQVKEMNSGQQRRFRFVISDSEYFVQAMVNVALSAYVDSLELQRGMIIALTRYQATMMKEKMIIVIQEFEQLREYGVMDRIGTPVAPGEKEEDGGVSTTTSMSDAATTGSTTFYGQTTTSAQTKAPQSVAPKREEYASHNQSYSAAPVMREGLYTIDRLSPYQNNWTIKARVTSKSTIREYHNQRNQGKLFSVNLLDETSEIKATGFNKQCDEFYDMLREGEVYYISKCRVNIAKKQFSNLPNDYELTMEDQTVIEPCTDSGAIVVPQLRFNFIDSLSSLNAVEKDALVDVVAVVKEIRDCSQIVSKSSGRPFDKRDIVVVDQSNFSSVLTAWGALAKEFTATVGDVVALKGAKVGDFNGRSLSLLSSSTMTVNPDVPEAHKLRGWYATGGSGALFTAITGSGTSGALTGRPENLKTLQQVKDENLGMSDAPDYFSVKATIGHIRSENFAYPACLTEGCNKKMVDEGSEWRCEKCNKTYEHPNYRYILMFNVFDHTGQMWLSTFDDVGKIVMGRPAGELYELRNTNSEEFEKEVAQRLGITFMFRVRGRQDTYQNTTRAKYNALSAAPLDYAQESTNLIKSLSDMAV